MAKATKEAQETKAIRRYIKLTFIEPVLGTWPSNENVARDFIASKSPDANTIEDEVAAIGAEAVADKAMTVFPRVDGKPVFWDYQIKGFFKDTCSALARAKYTKSSGLKAFKKVIDGMIFPFPPRNFHQRQRRNRRMPAAAPCADCAGRAREPRKLRGNPGWKHDSVRRNTRRPGARSTADGVAGQWILPWSWSVAQLRQGPVRLQDARRRGQQPRRHGREIRLHDAGSELLPGGKGGLIGPPNGAMAEDSAAWPRMAKAWVRLALPCAASQRISNAQQCSAQQRKSRVMRGKEWRSDARQR